MLLGFSKIMKDGRKTEKTYDSSSLSSTTTITETVTYGYLTDDNFTFAYSEINKILRKSRKTKKEFLYQSYSLYKRIKVLKKNVLKFKNYLKILDKSHKVDIEPSDAQKIVSFHKFGYIEKIENLTDVSLQELGKRYKYERMKHFLYDCFNNLNKELTTISSKLKQEEKSLCEDLRVLRRNVDFITRLKIDQTIFQPKKGRSVTKMGNKRKSVKIKVNCPQCGRSLKGATREMIGETGVCSKCKAEFVIEKNNK